MRKQLLKKLIDIYLSRLINKIEIDYNRIEFLVVWDTENIHKCDIEIISVKPIS